VDRQGGLCGLGQPVEVGEHRGTRIAQLEIELAAGTQLQQVELQAPPGQEAAVVGAGVLDPAVGEAVQPGVEVGEEVANGLDQGPPDDQVRPALSFRKRALARSRATAS
jgi:hypothetical protein